MTDAREAPEFKIGDQVRLRWGETVWRIAAITPNGTLYLLCKGMEHIVKPYQIDQVEPVSEGVGARNTVPLYIGQ